MSNFDSFGRTSKPHRKDGSPAKGNRDNASGFLNLQPKEPIKLSVVDGRVVLLLPNQSKQDDDWQAIIQRLNQKLAHPMTTWDDHAKVDLISNNRLLDGRQLQLISKLLINAKLDLDCIHTSRRQTAMAAVTSGYSVQQTISEQLFERLRDQEVTPNFLKASEDPGEPLVLTKTLRSGTEIKHPGLVIILGDVNPGGTLIAHGDIVVWGKLRGVAHAGAGGDRNACIMALKMEPTQLRIADKVARAPAQQLEEFYPEVAHIAADSIRITRAYDFSRLN